MNNHKLFLVVDFALLPCQVAARTIRRWRCDAGLCRALVILRGSRATLQRQGANLGLSSFGYGSTS